MKKRCNHKTRKYDWGLDSAGRSVAIRLWCVACGVTLSIGKANDKTPQVKIELRATVLEARERQGRTPRFGKRSQWSFDERAGWYVHGFGRAPEHSRGHQAGWLARQMFPADMTHDAADVAEPAVVSGAGAARPEQTVETPTIEPLPEVAHCAEVGCRESVATSNAVAAGWAMINGLWRCPKDAPLACDAATLAQRADVIDGIDQRAPEAPEEPELIDHNDEGGPL